MIEQNKRSGGQFCRINYDGTPADNRSNEEWIPIKDFEHRNWISNEGRVLSLGRTIKTKNGQIRTYKEKVLTLKPKTNGYTRAQLFHDGKMAYEYHLVHRLVASHFISNPNKLPVVNHIDEVRDNNHIANLEWVTVQQNLTHNDCHIRGAIKRRKPVKQLNLKGELIRLWSCVDEAHEHGYRKGSIRKVIYGIKKKHKNCIWEYEKTG